MIALAVACELRLKRYMKHKRQDDEIKSLKGHQDAVEQFLENINVTNLTSYFQIAYALQCSISKQFDLKNVFFYFDPKLLNSRLHYCLENFENFVKFAKGNKAVNYNPTFKLQSAEKILDHMENEAKFDHKQKNISFLIMILYWKMTV